MMETDYITMTYGDEDNSLELDLDRLNSDDMETALQVFLAHLTHFEGYMFFEIRTR